MVEKLHEEYKARGLDINFEKTKQLVDRDEGTDLIIGTESIKNTRFLGVTKMEAVAKISTIR